MNLVIGALLILLLYFPIFCLQKIKIAYIPGNSLGYIVILQICLSILWKISFRDMTLLGGMILTSFFYFVCSNSERIELSTSFPTIYEDSNLGVFKSSMKFLYGFILIIMRYFELVVFFICSLKLLVEIFHKHKETIDFFKSVFELQLSLILCIWAFSILYYYTRIQYKRLVILSLIFISWGVFDLKYWTIITILTSILALTFSDNFVREFITEKALKEINLYFFRFVTIYSTLLLYISLIVVKDIITEKQIENFFKVFMYGGTKNSSNVPIYFIYAVDGILQLAIFVMLWGLGKKILKGMNMFNYIFFQQISLLEDKVRFSLKKLR